MRSIFATHWHEIFFNPAINLQNIKLIKMHCNGDNASYKLTAGKGLNSSAFYSALQVGVDKKIIVRSEEIAKNRL